MRTWNTSQMITMVAVACLAAASTITIGSGGGSSNPNRSTPAPTPIPTASQGTGSIVGSVSWNHPLPHVAVITAVQLSVRVGLILDISNGLHSHTVTLTGAQVMQIASGGRVSVESSTDTHSVGANPHQHTVTFN